MLEHAPALFALPLCLSLVACDKKDEKKAEDETSADAKKDDEKKAEEAKPEAEAKPAEEEKVELVMIEHDLTSADPEWEGWVAKGPEGAKVMADGVKGARIAAGRDIDWDLAWAPKKRDLAELKKNLEKGAESSEGKVKLTFTTETPEALEWTYEGYGATKYNFVMHMEVDGKEITCKNNYMVGIPSEELREQHKQACLTLAKKAAE